MLHIFILEISILCVLHTLLLCLFQQYFNLFVSYFRMLYDYHKFLTCVIQMRIRRGHLDMKLFKFLSVV